MKILVVDDHALVREGLRQVLKGFQSDVEVLEAAHCARAFELAALHPDLDLVLLDYHLPDMDGMAALKVFGQCHPELPIFMLSGSVNPQLMRQVLAQGAAGFITKSSMSEELVSALRQVLTGDIYMPPELLMVPGSGNLTPQLTPRQEDVLQLLLDGHANKEISHTLQLSDETVKNHVTAILRGFGVQTRTQAVLAATRYGYKSGRPA